MRHEVQLGEVEVTRIPASVLINSLEMESLACRRHQPSASLPPNVLRCLSHGRRGRGVRRLAPSELKECQFFPVEVGK